MKTGRNEHYAPYICTKARTRCLLISLSTMVSSNCVLDILSCKAFSSVARTSDMYKEEIKVRACTSCVYLQEAPAVTPALDIQENIHG